MYQQLAWGFSWLVFVLDNLTTKTIFTTIQLANTLIIPLVSAFVNLVFALFIYTGYSGTTLSRNNDQSFGLWYALFLFAFLDI